MTNHLNSFAGIDVQYAVVADSATLELLTETVNSCGRFDRRKNWFNAAHRQPNPAVPLTLANPLHFLWCGHGSIVVRHAASENAAYGAHSSLGE